MNTLKGQDREIGKRVRAAGLLKRINDEILKPAGFILHFEYDDNPDLFGPYEIHITAYKPEPKKKPKTKKEPVHGDHAS